MCSTHTGRDWLLTLNQLAVAGCLIFFFTYFLCFLSCASFSPSTSPPAHYWSLLKHFIWSLEEESGTGEVYKLPLIRLTCYLQILQIIELIGLFFFSTVKGFFSLSSSHWLILSYPDYKGWITYLEIRIIDNKPKNNSCSRWCFGKKRQISHDSVAENIISDFRT